jgi:hypothetical protein
LLSQSGDNPAADPRGRYRPERIADRARGAALGNGRLQETMPE